MLGPQSRIKLVGLKALGHLEELEETGQSLTENALQKVNFIYEKYGAPVFAEDTGLEVDALDGAPGVHSGRYGGPEKEKLLADMTGLQDRSARFRTIIAFRSHEEIMTFEGHVNGQITTYPSGEGGFGYDPVFRPNGFSETFGTLPAEIKQRISHRAMAWARLKSHLVSAIL